MIKRMMVLLVGGLLALPAGSLAQQVSSAAFDTSRMQRDLEIMEAILDRLFDHAQGPHFFGGERSRGVFLPGYGVVFQVPRSDLSIQIFHELAPVVAGEETRTPRPSPGRRVSIRKRSAEKTVRGELQHFFSNYADAIGQINENERVVVYLAGGRGFEFFVPTGEAAVDIAGRSQNILASVRKGDIVALRSGKLGEQEFNQRCSYRELRDDERDADLEVMGNIFETALRSQRQRASSLRLETQPVYVEGLGALFIFSANFENPAIFEVLQTPEPPIAPVQQEMRDLERHLIELQNASKRAKSTWQIEYKNLRSRFADILADYGHTLRRLQRNEWIVVATNLGDAPEGYPRELVCRVQKQHIDAYNGRTLSRDNLIKKIDFLEY